MELFTIASRNIPKPMSGRRPRPHRLTVKDGRFKRCRRARSRREDHSRQRKGALNGSDLVKMLLDHPATSQRLAGKLVRLFSAKRALLQTP